MLAAMMRNEKSGGHSERSIGIGTIEVAMWDAVAKIAGKPLHVLLAERHNGGKVQDKCFVYVGGGWYAPGKGIPELQDEMKRHLDAGYTMVKMKVGGAPLDEDMRRIEAVKSILPPHAELAVDANSKFDRAEALALRQGDGAVPAALVRGAVRSARLRDAGGHFGCLSARALDRREPVLHAGRGESRALRQSEAGAARRDPGRSAAGLRHRAICPHAAALEKYQWPRSGHFPHGGNQMSLAIAAGFGLGGAESYPGVFGVFAGFADDAVIENGYISLSDRPGIGFEGQAALYAVMRDLAA